MCYSVDHIHEFHFNIQRLLNRVAHFAYQSKLIKNIINVENIQNCNINLIEASKRAELMHTKKVHTISSLICFFFFLSLRTLSVCVCVCFLRQRYFRSSIFRLLSVAIAENRHQSLLILNLWINFSRITSSNAHTTPTTTTGSKETESEKKNDFHRAF